MQESTETRPPQGTEWFLKAVDLWERRKGTEAGKLVERKRKAHWNQVTTCFKDCVFYLTWSNRPWSEPLSDLPSAARVDMLSDLQGAKLFLPQDLHICCSSHTQFFPHHSPRGILSLSSCLNWNATSLRYLAPQSEVVPPNSISHHRFVFSIIVIPFLSSYINWFVELQSKWNHQICMLGCICHLYWALLSLTT